MRAQLTLEFYHSLMLIAFTMMLLFPVFLMLQGRINTYTRANQIRAFGERLSLMLFLVSKGGENSSLRIELPQRLGGEEYRLNFTYGQSFGFIVLRDWIFAFKVPSNINTTSLGPGIYEVKVREGKIIWE
ncbi:MAG: hypothetical protein QW507_00885 [Candidatus Nanoarchaeia archaeon]|nr:hypothetical protein [Candidatus Haiyanarchaeum thermophilum]MCW1303371.1 hypothetical protein [Candidatus Haiyanarchaeum thermophilum]MCW1303942.1 hypothetical protein [Candidatus Haiyanarchaeum thermophilum]MCW1306733.1 hypothetical protein [Candidatus Haiyanarchaeum thermophilum]MCW1307570.1 hypothetical protein [Candidatus Haiyanarchaeum thermophilum]